MIYTWSVGRSCRNLSQLILGEDVMEKDLHDLKKYSEKEKLIACPILRTKVCIRESQKVSIFSRPHSYLQYKEQSKCQESL